MKIDIPDSGLEIISTLEGYGFKAFLVGGAVRNSLLSLPIKDYDIATNATPEEVIDLFTHNAIVIPTGIEHGTVTILFQDGSYEVTTFRTESGFSDGRHPDKVEFVKTLQEDLKRRDFSCNSIAYHPKTGLIDPFNGVEDLKNGRWFLLSK